MASRLQYAKPTRYSSDDASGTKRPAQQLRRSARRDELGELCGNGLIPAPRRSPKPAESEQ